MMKFGTGNFEVSPQGHITAKGGGTIAGWNIADKELYQGKVGMSSNNKNDDGTSNDKQIAFWAGKSTDSKAEAPFRVNFDGEIVAEAGTIGGWILSNKTISANGITLDSSGSIKANNDKWSITSGGVANFKDINITGGGATFGTRFDVTGAAWNDFQNLTAETAVIGELWAETANIKKLIADEIEAVNAKIGTLTADIVNVKGRLTAAEADISYIESNYVKTDSLSAKVASIMAAGIDSLQVNSKLTVYNGGSWQNVGSQLSNLNSKVGGLLSDVERLEDRVAALGG